MSDAREREASGGSEDLEMLENSLAVGDGVSAWSNFCGPKDPKAVNWKRQGGRDAKKHLTTAFEKRMLTIDTEEHEEIEGNVFGLVDSVRSLADAARQGGVRLYSSRHSTAKMVEFRVQGKSGTEEVLSRFEAEGFAVSSDMQVIRLLLKIHKELEKLGTQNK